MMVNLEMNKRKIIGRIFLRKNLGLGRSPGVGNGNPLQYSCLGNPTDRGAWQTTVYGIEQSDMT